MNRNLSAALFRRALKAIPGGVNSPVRAWKAVGGTPLFINRGMGAKIYDSDGNSFIDYICSWGPLILGHSHPDVLKAMRKALASGTSFGAPSEAELELCELITQSIPSVKKVRLVNSGTEAVMSAIRVARAFTGRNKILKFEGCYHGHWDPLLVQAGSGLATFSVSSSAGVTKEMVKDTFVSPYNDLSAIERIFSSYGNDIACIIVEPVAGNMGTVLPHKNFLKGLRKITNQYGALLIFDEVITGFRIGKGGAQAHYKVSPDLTCLGKIIGGGMPIGAYGGKSEIMGMVSPLGKVYQAGTLSGNPISAACGIATIKTLFKNNIYKDLEEKTQTLCRGMKGLADKHGISVVINRIGSMFTVFFTGQGSISSFADAKRCDMKLYARYFNLMLDEGIYIPPSQFETNFLSAAHGEREIKKTLKAVEIVFSKLAVK